jgi:hypothetical protein
MGLESVWLDLSSALGVSLSVLTAYSRTPTAQDPTMTTAATRVTTGNQNVSSPIVHF